MSETFFFYDLETSGFSPREARIMQFAGQRTNLKLEPIGEPVNILIKLTPDILPDPSALMVTGITPQSTLADGISEAEFLKIFYEQVAVPGTIFAGYNSVRFDDEFMRFLNYRNFYDAYEWQWKDGRSRWDLLDAVRMTRALRPGGIEWPFGPDGAPSNRLGFMTAVNKLDHANAHDALGDVLATISVARLIRDKQTKLFDFMLNLRDKNKIAALVEDNQPFVYTSGKYASEFEKTTVAIRIANHPKKKAALVYDVRQDPTEFINLSVKELIERWRYNREDERKRLPVKTLQYNRCPAVAPMGVLDKASQERLKIDLKVIEKNMKTLSKAPQFAENVLAALEQMDKKQQAEMLSNEQTVDAKLYDGFFDNADRQSMSVVRAAAPEELGELNLDFHDNRLISMLPLYKARNFPQNLNSEERAVWDTFCKQRLLDGGEQSRLAKYFGSIQTIAEAGHLTKNQEYLLEEMKLYGESVMPIADAAE